MPNKNTPPKHRTPNYKLVTKIVNGVTFSTWTALPLRQDRKDFHLVEVTPAN